MLKFFARLGGMRVEFIIHTNQSWVNYMYQRDVAHDEYEVKRIFDSGVAELLFPHDIYFPRSSDGARQYDPSVSKKYRRGMALGKKRLPSAVIARWPKARNERPGYPVKPRHRTP